MFVVKKYANSMMDAVISAPPAPNLSTNTKSSPGYGSKSRPHIQLSWHAIGENALHEAVKYDQDAVVDYLLVDWSQTHLRIFH